MGCKPQCAGIGYECKAYGRHSSSMGYMASATKDNSVSVGTFVSSIHKNATVIGTNLTSKRENSTLFNQAEFREDGLYMNNGTVLIDGKNETSQKCTSCDRYIKNGVQWIKDGYVDAETVYDSVTMGLCFDCMLECVLEFKGRMSWNRKTG